MDAATALPLWSKGDRVHGQRQGLPWALEVARDIGLHHGHHAVADGRLGLNTQRAKRSVLAPKEVHHQRDVADGAVGQPRLFEDHRWPVVLDQQVGDGACFVDDVDGARDAQHLAALLQVVHPPLEGPPCHGLLSVVLPLDLR